jgi:hypothetical protein
MRRRFSDSPPPVLFESLVVALPRLDTQAANAFAIEAGVDLTLRSDDTSDHQAGLLIDEVAGGVSYGVGGVHWLSLSEPP